MSSFSCLSRREYLVSFIHELLNLLWSTTISTFQHNPFSILTTYSCVVLDMICCMIDVENICIVKGHGGFMIDHPGFAYVTTRTMAAISFLSLGMQTVIQMERMCSSCC
jgi:hypothetical protein